MASPVDASVKNFNSAISGALALSGTQNALAVMLDAYLKDGSDTKTLASLTVAGGVATAAFTGTHGAIAGSVVLIAGVTGGPAGFAGLNGEQRVTAVAAGVVRYATALPDGTYTGTITMKMAPLGWLKPFNFANGGVYKSADPASTGMLVRVDDSGTLNARVRAYESMSDANTGLGLTPLESQVPGGLYWPKSGAAGATARPWYLVGDGRGFYLAVAPLAGERFTLIYVGDFASVKSGDAYGFVLTGGESDQTTASTAPWACCGWSGRTARGGAYIPRLHTNIGQAILAQRLGAHHNGATSDTYAGAAGYSVGNYPNGPNNGLMIGALELMAQGIRGTLPGLLHPVHDLGNLFASGSIVDGTDDYAGRKLMALRVAPPTGSGSAGTVFLDLTGPWSR